MLSIYLIKKQLAFDFIEIIRKFVPLFNRGREPQINQLDYVSKN